MIDSATAKYLSTAGFESSVAELAPKIAVFDCDGTLWSGDAGSSFMAWTIEHEMLLPERVEWLAERYAGYHRKEVSELAICGEMVQVYAGLTEATMRAAAKAFFAERIEQNIFPEMRRLLARLKAEGVEIWAVSSTNDWVIEEGVTRFGILPDKILCARVAIENGVVTDRVLDVPTDEGKVTALRRAGVPAPDAVFGNSVHDAAMLAIAQRAYPVNATPALVERSALEGWAVYYPASVRPEGLALEDASGDYRGAEGV